MGEVKHTPGPWMYLGADPWSTPSGEFVQWGEFRISANSLDMADEDYYRIGSVSNANDDGTNEANARLIAAAPELLEALKIARDFMSIASDWNLDEAEIGGEMRSTYDWLEIVTGAIAKALAPKDTQ